MKRGILMWRIGVIVLLVLLHVLAIAPIAQASGVFPGEEPVPITLINTAVAYIIFILGVRVVYLTRGGFLSIAFIFITTGITIGWVVKLGFEFLTDYSILSTTLDVVGVAEALGGIMLAVGFALLSKKLKG
ncbi:MAG TPA: hypothetical protein VE439_05185 [Anaerolineae bacterium]|jgi:hypothetical protein|nr:hypothetical protein [Anaerolineae bacterium]